MFDGHRQPLSLPTTPSAFWAKDLRLLPWGPSGRERRGQERMADGQVAAVTEATVKKELVRTMKAHSGAASRAAEGVGVDAKGGGARG